MRKMGRIASGVLVMVLLAVPAFADLSAFVASVGFDEDANLDRGMGFGLRWGKSSGLIGGETSLLIARPERDLSVSKETATALFYDGRLLVNIPLGKIKPFVGVGFGAVTITSTDVEVPGGADEALTQALNTMADLQTNTAVSYGAGVRYGLAERLDLRVDLRQYLVFSVQGLAEEQVRRELAEQTGLDIEPKDNTVQYNEFSVGVSIKF